MPSTRRIAAWIALAAALAAVVTGPARAAGGDGGGATVTAENSAEYKAGLDAIQAQRWDEAIRQFTTHVSRAPNDADGLNWLGYAWRKSGNLGRAFTYYKRALSIDPQHKGVHEYIGEAYVMEGNLAQAQVHLKRLAEICNAACEEYADLKKAIESRKVP